MPEEDTRRLREAFGDQFERALDLLEEKRVKRYTFEPSGRVLWIAVGREREYLILPKAHFCSCDDFYFRVVDGEAGLCYHLISQCLAEALGKFDDVRDNDEFYESLMSEWREQALGASTVRA